MKYTLIYLFLLVFGFMSILAMTASNFDITEVEAGLYVTIYTVFLHYGMRLMGDRRR
jgi:predicted MFS family arabinose efflux permease